MKRTGLCMLAVAFLMSSTGYAQEPPPPAQKQQEQAAKQLVLTSEQKEKIQNLRLEWQKTQVMIQADRKVASLELQSLLKDKNAAESKIQAQMEKVSQQDIKLKMGAIKLQNSIKSVLTPEQQKLFKNRQAAQNLRGRNFNRRGHAHARMFNRHRGTERTTVRGGAVNRQVRSRRQFTTPRGTVDMNARFRIRFNRDAVAPRANRPGMNRPMMPGRLFRNRGIIR